MELRLKSRKQPDKDIINRTSAFSGGEELCLIAGDHDYNDTGLSMNNRLVKPVVICKDPQLL